MKTARKLSLFGILGLITAVLFLISISFTQANVKTKGNPNGGSEAEEATWAVRIPTITEASEQGLMFYGMEDGYYGQNKEGDYHEKGLDHICQRDSHESSQGSIGKDYDSCY